MILVNLIVPAGPAETYPVTLLIGNVELGKNVQPVRDKAALKVAVPVIEIGIGYDRIVLTADPVPQIVPQTVVPVCLEIFVPRRNLKGTGTDAHPEKKRRGQRNQDQSLALKSRHASSHYGFKHWPPSFVFLSLNHKYFCNGGGAYIESVSPPNVGATLPITVYFIIVYLTKFPTLREQGFGF